MACSANEHHYRSGRNVDETRIHDRSLSIKIFRRLSGGVHNFPPLAGLALENAKRQVFPVAIDQDIEVIVVLAAAAKKECQRTRVG